MTIDDLEYHVDDAGSREAAAAHLAVFVLWASRNGLLSPSHDARAIEADPIRYVLDRLPVLAASDFTDEGASFVEAEYAEYLDIVADHAVEAGVSSYELAASPAGRALLLAGLDEALADLRER